MLPPGLGVNIVGPRALARHASAAMPRSYWDWSAVLAWNEEGMYPYTPATNMLYGLRTAVSMLEAEGLDEVHRRHARLGLATRAAYVRGAWSLTAPILIGTATPSLPCGCRTASIPPMSAARRWTWAT
jgi:alanine-glyoxylate transaminase/serine-glyoxylate transaminase/serine-pyruvate transaminase